MTSQFFTGTDGFDERAITGEQPRKPPYWYFYTTYECALCGRTKRYKERKYTPKPDDRMKRGSWHQDACSEHFL